jgi:hypothetical protein
LPSCAIQTERTVTIGTARVKHILPLVHIQRISAAEADEETREQGMLRNSFGKAWKDNPGYGAFRIDFARRLLRDGMNPEKAAAYLEQHQAAGTWPDHDFGNEIRYWRARANGERVCDACLEILPPAPPCDCGCQKAARPVPGFALLGRSAVASLASGTVAPLSPAPTTRPELPTAAGIDPGAPGASKATDQELAALSCRHGIELGVPCRECAVEDAYDGNPAPLTGQELAGSVPRGTPPPEEISDDDNPF